MTAEALGSLSPEEHHHVYKMLRLTVEVSPDEDQDALDVSGVPGDSFVQENKHQGIRPAEDEIQLPEAVPEAGAVGAFDDLVALLYQVAQREVLAPRSSGTSAQGPTPA